MYHFAKCCWIHRLHGPTSTITTTPSQHSEAKNAHRQQHISMICRTHVAHARTKTVLNSCSAIPGRPSHPSYCFSSEPYLAVLQIRPSVSLSGFGPRAPGGGAGGPLLTWCAVCRICFRNRPELSHYFSKTQRPVPYSALHKSPKWLFVTCLPR